MSPFVQSLNTPLGRPIETVARLNTPVGYLHFFGIALIFSDELPIHAMVNTADGEGLYGSEIVYCIADAAADVDQTRTTNWRIRTSPTCPQHSRAISARDVTVT